MRQAVQDSAKVDQMVDTRGARLIALKAALKLELKGMVRSRPPSAYSMLRKEYGYQGSREKVLAAVEHDISIMLGERGVK